MWIAPPPPPPASISLPVPTETDFEFAQVRIIHAEMGLGDNGIVHCRKFRGYRTAPADGPSAYRVTYREYVGPNAWRKLSAVVRREGDEWVWVKGDHPKCFVTIFR
jgi:hypothetical protein